MIRLMTYNILNGGAGRIDPLAEVIRHVDPHVVACPEADRRDDFELLARRLGMAAYWAEPVEKHPLGVLSRLPMISAENLARRPMQRTCARVRVRLPNGDAMTVFALHLRPRLSMEREQVRLREVDLLLELTAPDRAAGAAHVLMGDFNASHPEQAIDPERLRPKDRRILDEQGQIVPREAVGRLLAAGYVDAYHRLRGSAGGCTLSTRRPGLRVDYVMLSPCLAERLRACDVRRERLATYASDHYPVWADLDL